MLKKMTISGIALCAVLSLGTGAHADDVELTIDDLEGQPDIEIWLSEGVGRYGSREFGISGGRPDFPSPTGAFQIEWRSRNWWSKQWDAPMPYAMFFHNGAAIHVGSLNSRSHGCIRVTEETARFLFANTKDKQTRVFVYP